MLEQTLSSYDKLVKDGVLSEVTAPEGETWESDKMLQVAIENKVNGATEEFRKKLPWEAAAHLQMSEKNLDNKEFINLSGAKANIESIDLTSENPDYLKNVYAFLSGETNPDVTAASVAALLEKGQLADRLETLKTAKLESATSSLANLETEQQNLIRTVRESYNTNTKSFDDTLKETETLLGVTLNDDIKAKMVAANKADTVSGKGKDIKAVSKFDKALQNPEIRSKLLYLVESGLLKDLNLAADKAPTPNESNTDGSKLTAILNSI